MSRGASAVFRAWRGICNYCAETPKWVFPSAKSRKCKSDIKTPKLKFVEMKLRTILLFGAPGSGKGTQGKILGSVPNFFHCACGDVFRNLTIDNELGRTFI